MARTVQEIQEAQKILATKQAELKATMAALSASGTSFEGQVARLQGLAALSEIEIQQATLQRELANAAQAPAVPAPAAPIPEIVPQTVTSPPPIPQVVITSEGDVIQPQPTPPVTAAPAQVPVVTAEPAQAPAAVDTERVPESANASSGYFKKQKVEDPPLLTPAQSIAKAQKQPEVVDPAVAAANFNAATNQSILSAITPVNNTTSGYYTGATPRPSSTNLPPEIKFSKAEDWRVRLTLAPGSKYFYNAEDPGILEPLISTNGVIFPYTPTVQMGYKANYDTTEVTHSNYKLHFYKNSSVEDVTITADFTAQDTVEANYLLAVMHFFKTATKMFYGQDVKPTPGTPPPLLYLSGFGTYQYDNHPLVLTSFAYTLPNDVDYIRAGVSDTWAGSSISALTGNSSAKAPTNPITGFINKIFRIKSNGLQPGGQKPTPTFKSLSNNRATYVPSKLQITLTLHPMVTRRDISQNFSLQKYATGELLQGSKRQGGGIW
jgi:hypothetical protein